MTRPVPTARHHTPSRARLILFVLALLATLAATALTIAYNLKARPGDPEANVFSTVRQHFANPAELPTPRK